METPEVTSVSRWGEPVRVALNDAVSCGGLAEELVFS